MAVNGVPNLAIDCPLKRRLRSWDGPPRVDGSRNNGSVAYEGGPGGGVGGAGGASGNAQPSGAGQAGAAHAGAGADPLAPARTDGSGQNNGLATGGNNGANVAGGQPAAGGAEGGETAGGGERGSSGGGNGSSAAQQTLHVDPNQLSNPTDPSRADPGGLLDNPSPAEQADRQAFQQELANLLDQAQNGDADAADALKQKFAEFQEKFLQPKLDNGNQLADKWREPQSDQFEKKQERAEKRHQLEQDTATWRKNLDARQRILQAATTARPNLKPQAREQVARWQRQVQAARDRVSQESAATGSRAEGDGTRVRAYSFRQVVAGTASSRARPGGRDAGGRGTHRGPANRGGAPRNPRPTVMPRGTDGSLQTLRRGPDGQLLGLSQQPKQRPAPAPKAADAKGGTEQALADAGRRDKPEPKKGERRQAATDRPAVEEGAEAGCLESETNGGEETAYAERQDDAAAAETGPKDSPAHVLAAGEAVQRLKTEEDRQKISDRRGALAATLSRVSKTRGDIAAAAGNVPQQGAGQTAARAMQRGAVMTVAERQRFGEDCKRGLFGVVDGGSCEGVVYLDPDLPRAARGGAGVSEPGIGAERAAEIMRARPDADDGGEAFARNRVALRQIIGQKGPFEASILMNFRTWARDDQSMRALGTKVVATGGTAV